MFDEEVESAIQMFEACYRIGRSGRHERVALPSVGSELDQEAWLLDAMATIAETVDREREYEARAASQELRTGHVRSHD